MTTLAQIQTQTMPCRKGCDVQVHYGINPDNGYEGRGTTRAWMLVGGRWVEHFD